MESTYNVKMADDSLDDLEEENLSTDLSLNVVPDNTVEKKN